MWQTNINTHLTDSCHSYNSARVTSLHLPYAVAICIIKSDIPKFYWLANKWLKSNELDINTEVLLRFSFYIKLSNLVEIHLNIQTIPEKYQIKFIVFQSETIC